MQTLFSSYIYLINGGIILRLALAGDCRVHSYQSIIIIKD